MPASFDTQLPWRHLTLSASLRETPAVIYGTLFRLFSQIADKSVSRFCIR
jgi:hypothetical protein